MNVPLRKVHVVVVCFAQDGDLGFEAVIGQRELLVKLAGFLRHKVEH